VKRTAILTALMVGSGAGVGISLADGQPSCQLPPTVQTVTFSRARYPLIYRHWLDATAKGWPRVLIVERSGTDGRRDRLLASVPTRPGMDRDEYPPSVGREGWLADVEYVPSSENRSQGASLGGQLRGLCDGARVEYVWRP
jgi:hypothetical protein